MRILIVDDDATSRMILARLLAPYGVCDTASDGEDAFGKVMRAHGDVDPYRLITMDITMPGASGQEVVARIRRFEDAYRVFHDGRDAKVLMVTGSRDAKSVYTSFRMGCEGVIHKPFDAEQLRVALAKIEIEAKTSSSAAG